MPLRSTSRALWLKDVFFISVCPGGAQAAPDAVAVLAVGLALGVVVVPGVVVVLGAGPGLDAAVVLAAGPGLDVVVVLAAALVPGEASAPDARPVRSSEVGPGAWGSGVAPRPPPAWTVASLESRAGAQAFALAGTRDAGLVQVVT